MLAEMAVGVETAHLATLRAGWEIDQVCVSSSFFSKIGQGIKHIPCSSRWFSIFFVLTGCVITEK